VPSGPGRLLVTHRRIFPVSVRGRSVTNSMRRGYL
jgi:hypothetical protein